MPGQQMHAVTESLNRGSAMANTTVADVEGKRTQVNALAADIRAGWHGTAPQQGFDPVHGQWNNDVTHALRILEKLGIDINYAAALDVEADEVGRGGILSAMNGSTATV